MYLEEHPNKKKYLLVYRKQNLNYNLQVVETELSPFRMKELSPTNTCLQWQKCHLGNARVLGGTKAQESLSLYPQFQQLSQSEAQRSDIQQYAAWFSSRKAALSLPSSCLDLPLCQTE